MEKLYRSGGGCGGGGRKDEPRHALLLPPTPLDFGLSPPAAAVASSLLLAMFQYLLVGETKGHVAPNWMLSSAGVGAGTLRMREAKKRIAQLPISDTD